MATAASRPSPAPAPAPAPAAVSAAGRCFASASTRRPSRAAASENIDVASARARTAQAASATDPPRLSFRRGVPLSGATGMTRLGGRYARRRGAVAVDPAVAAAAAASSPPPPLPPLRLLLIVVVHVERAGGGGGGGGERRGPGVGELAREDGGADAVPCCCCRRCCCASCSRVAFASALPPRGCLQLGRQLPQPSELQLATLGAVDRRLARAPPSPRPSSSVASWLPSSTSASFSCSQPHSVTASCRVAGRAGRGGSSRRSADSCCGGARNATSRDGPRATRCH